MEEYKAPTTGANAVPLILTTLLKTHRDDFRKLSDVSTLGVNSIAALIRWRDGKIAGRVKKSRRDELTQQWAGLLSAVGETVVRDKAAEFEGAVTVRVGVHDYEDDNGDDEGEGGEFEADHQALVGREVRDTTGGLGTSILKIVDLVASAAGPTARVYPSDQPLPADLADMEEVLADDLCDSDTFEWVDGRDGRASVTAAQDKADATTAAQAAEGPRVGPGLVQAQPELTEDDMEINEKFFTDSDDPPSLTDPLKVYAVRASQLPQQHRQAHRGYVMLAHCHYSSSPAPDPNEDSEIAYPVSELKSDPAITWLHNFTPAQTPASELFADLELASLHIPKLASVGRGGEGDGDEEREPAMVEVTNDEDVGCLPATEHVLSFNERRRSKFHEEVAVTLSGGAGDGDEGGEAHVLRRHRNFDDDVVLVFMDDDGNTSRVRAEEFRTAPDGEVYVLGSCMYSRSDLPAQLVSNLPFAFDDDRELVEGINPCEWLLAEVVSFRRVVASAEVARKEHCCHQLAWFVDDDPDGRAWKLASRKERPSTGLVGVEAMDVDPAGDLETEDSNSPPQKRPRLARKAKQGSA